MKNFRLSISRPIALAIIVVLFLTGGLFAFFMSRGSGNSPGETVDTDGINYGPPTEEEQNAGDEQKNRITEELNNQSNDESSSSLKTATVIVTDAGQYGDTIEVRAFIPDHYQDGTCTITFRQNNNTVTKDTPAYRDASTTICTNQVFKRSEFPSTGSWQVSVAYKSTNAQGVSASQYINIE